MSRVILMLAFVFSAALAQAQTVKPPATVKKSTTTIITKEEEGTEEEMAGKAPEEKPTESVITAKFGSKSGSGTAGCKTEELSKTAVKGLKSDCSAWMKDRQTELKTRYLTGSCEEECDDCGMSLKRCMVNGRVHYLVK